MPHLLAAVVWVGAMCCAAWAQAQPAATRAAETFPSKPVRVIVSASAGALTDTQARLFSQKLSESFRQQVITDNRPGAGGLIGFRTVAGAAPDGYTLLAASPSLTTVHAFQEHPGYDPVRVITAVVQNQIGKENFMPKRF